MKEIIQVANQKPVAIILSLVLVARHQGLVVHLINHHQGLILRRLLVVVGVRLLSVVLPLKKEVDVRE